MRATRPETPRRFDRFARTPADAYHAGREPALYQLPARSATHRCARESRARWSGCWRSRCPLTNTAMAAMPMAPPAGGATHATASHPASHDAHCAGHAMSAAMHAHAWDTRRPPCTRHMHGDGCGCCIGKTCACVHIFDVPSVMRVRARGTLGHAVVRASAAALRGHRSTSPATSDRLTLAVCRCAGLGAHFAALRVARRSRSRCAGVAVIPG